MSARPELWLLRHGETAWSAAGQHTGLTDLALTPTGEQQAKRLGDRLRGQAFALVLSSPLRRAHDTCLLAGYAEHAEPEPALVEWDYGGYEGRTSAEIRAEAPGWDIWSSGVPGGETLAQVAARAQRVIDFVLERVQPEAGPVALFAHGHLLRVLAATWLGLPPTAARLLALDTAAVSILGEEPLNRVLRLWNDTRHLLET